MTKTPIIFYSVIFVLSFANFVGNFPATYVIPLTEYYNVKKSMAKDDQFQQELDHSSISKKCNEQVYLSYLQAKDLETCVFQETKIRTTNYVEYYDDTILTFHRSWQLCCYVAYDEYDEHHYF